MLTRIGAAALVLLAVLPLWRVLPMRPTGLAGAATAGMAADYTSLILNGILLALIPAVLAALVFDAETLERKLARVVAPLDRPASVVFALLAALLALLVAAPLPHWIGPMLIDSFAQLTHARFLAAGEIAGPLTADQPFQHIQQTLITPNGWVSQYPPGYPVLLAIAMRVGALAWAGPVLHALAVFFTALLAERLFNSRVLARTAALLAALSPFMLGMAGTYMSHTPAAALVCVIVYCLLRAREGSPAWSAAAGTAVGALFAVRPLTGVVLGVAAIGFAASVALPWRARVSRIVFGLAAALPFLAGVAWYNHHFFGSATTFGYTAALGPNAGLGFGIDPWGNRYGVVEALAYTSAELAGLSLFLLETPLPLIALTGLYFVLHGGHAGDVTRLLFWVCAGLVFAGLFYWHHGLFMGPRMLADTGYLWVLLVTFAVAGLIARIRTDWLIAERYSPRAFATGGVVAAVIGGLVLLAPQRLSGYVQSTPSAPPVTQPALIFIHGGWTDRIAMRLAGHGMRLDSVETALRQNSTCAVHHFSLAYASGVAARVQLDFEPRAINLPPAVTISEGNRIRMFRDENIDDVCAAEIVADTAGVMDPTRFIWRGALPGTVDRGVRYVRDMGPAENAAIVARHAASTPHFLLPGAPTLLPYGVAMRQFWKVQP